MSASELLHPPGSALLDWLEREIQRLRRLADKVRVPKVETEDDDE